MRKNRGHIERAQAGRNCEASKRLSIFSRAPRENFCGIERPNTFSRTSRENRRVAKRQEAWPVLGGAPSKNFRGPERSCAVTSNNRGAESPERHPRHQTWPA